MLFVVLASVLQSSQGVPSHRSQLFGEELRPLSAQLLREIETAYRRNVREEYNVSLESSDAQSSVDNDGTPVIRIPPRSGADEALIVHEMMHLKGRAPGGEDRYELRFQPSWSPSAQEQARIHVLLVFLEATLADALRHRLFYPTMQAMGLDPYARHLPELHLLVSVGRLPSHLEMERHGFRFEALALSFAYASLHASDGAVVAKLRDTYESQGEEGPVQAAELALRRINAAPAKLNAKQRRTLFVLAANDVLRGFRLEETGISGSCPWNGFECVLLALHQR